MIKNTLLIAILLALSACSGMTTAPDDVQKKFTYDYSIPDTDKLTLWTRARNHIAHTYGDSSKVIRVEDKKAGQIIGIAAVAWHVMGYECNSEYKVSIATKDNKARLQLELTRGTPSYSECIGRDWPTTDGYKEVVASFNRLSNDLEGALNNTDNASDLMDF